MWWWVTVFRWVVLLEATAKTSQFCYLPFFSAAQLHQHPWALQHLAKLPWRPGQLGECQRHYEILWSQSPEFCQLLRTWWLFWPWSGLCYLSLSLSKSFFVSLSLCLSMSLSVCLSLSLSLSIFLYLSLLSLSFLFSVPLYLTLPPSLSLSFFHTFCLSLPFFIALSVHSFFLSSFNTVIFMHFPMIFIWTQNKFSNNEAF